MPIATEQQIYYKPISILVGRMVPDYMIAEYPVFITFMEKYFEYMEQELKQYDVVANLLNYRDIDNTLTVFESSFKEKFLHSFPESLAANVDLLVKNIRSFYKSRGTEDSFRFLFKALFNTDTTFFYPKTKILRTSDGNWFTPEYLVLEDQVGNTPPRFPNGDGFDLSSLVGKFIFGVTTGTVALVDDTFIQPYNGLSEIHIQILEKEGAFEVGEQIVLGSNIVQNGSFSEGTLNWTNDLPDEFITTNLLHELQFEQDPLDIRNKYIYQLNTVEVNTQYYLRYSLVSNKTSLDESAVRFDSNLSRVTVGITPGGNDLFDSGFIGTYVNADQDSVADLSHSLKWEPSGGSNGIVNIYHINYDIQSDPGSLTPVGAGLTTKDTARISEFEESRIPDYTFEADLDVDDSLDEIAVSLQHYVDVDAASTKTPDFDMKGRTGYVYWINDTLVDPATAHTISNDLIAAGNWAERGTCVINEINDTTNPDRVYISNITDRTDFDIDANVGTGVNPWTMIAATEGIVDTPTNNVYVWNSLATDEYQIGDYVIQGNEIYVVVTATKLTPAENDGSGGLYSRIKSVLTENPANAISNVYHTGDRVRLTDDGNTPPTGLSTDTDYFVIKVNDYTIMLADTLANALIGTQIDITALGTGTINLVVPTRTHFSAITTEADFVDKTTIHATNGYVFLTPLDDVLDAVNFFVWSSSATYALHDYAIKGDVLYKSTLASNTTDPAMFPLVNWVIVPSLFVDGPTALGPLNTLKLLPPTNSQQANLYITIHNEMAVAGQRGTFDGISLVAKDIQESPLLFIANADGVSGIVTGLAQFADTKGFLSSDMKLQDNDYYQEFSYEISSSVDKASFEQIVRDNLHPAGFKMFANVEVTPTDDSSLLDQTIDLQMFYGIKFPAQYLANADAQDVFAGDTDVDPTTDYITITDHQYTTGMAVRLRSNGNTVPVGLNDNTNYFVIRVDANNIQLATTVANASAGTQINITADGSGDIGLYKDGINIVASNINYHIEGFYGKGLTFAEVEYGREDASALPLLAQLAQTVADIPIGYFDTRAAESFPWSDSYEVTIA